tara:strand:- start:769 stop:975 length:207 start_codon:yes stop_codon:yes gene_type:complete
MNGQIIQRDTERFTLYSVKGLAGAGVVVDNSNQSQSLQPIPPQKVKELKDQQSTEFYNNCFKLIYNRP